MQPWRIVHTEVRFKHCGLFGLARAMHINTVTEFSKLSFGRNILVCLWCPVEFICISPGKKFPP